MQGFYYEFQALLSANLCYSITADQTLSLHLCESIYVIAGSKKIFSYSSLAEKFIFILTSIRTN